MINNKRRQTSVPCYTCLEMVTGQDDVVYCSVCGEQYHAKCWRKNSNKCKVYKCYGESYRLWHKIEPIFLGFLGVHKSKLLRECPNCQNRLSPLDRYCSTCGSDVNRPEQQNTFGFYNIALFIRKIRRVVYLLAFALISALILGITVSLVNAAGVARNYISARATQNAPTVTSTHRPYTVTPTFFTFTAMPTFTNTLLPTSTYTNTPRPTSTNTLRPTFTNTPRPTAILTPAPTKLVAFVTFNSTNKSAPVTINFNAENSYLEYKDGSQKKCYKLGCEYKWAFPDGVGYDFPSASIMPFRFTRSGTFKGYVTVCWQGICGDAVFSITIK